MVEESDYLMKIKKDIEKEKEQDKERKQKKAIEAELVLKENAVIDRIKE